MSCVCVYLYTSGCSGKDDGAVGIHEIGRHGRQRYQYRTRSRRGFQHDLGLSFIQQSFSTFQYSPSTNFSYVSFDSRHNATNTVLGLNTSEIMGHGNGCNIIWARLFTITVRGVTCL